MIQFNESYKTVVCSTGNITKDDSHLLTELSKTAFSRIAVRESGFFIKVDQFLIDESFEEFAGRFSSELRALLRAAVEQGANCIEIDCDGQAATNATLHNW